MLESGQEIKTDEEGERGRYSSSAASGGLVLNGTKQEVKCSLHRGVCKFPHAKTGSRIGLLAVISICQEEPRLSAGFGCLLRNWAGSLGADERRAC